MSATVVGRDEELAAIRTFLGRVEERPCALVLSGEAGIGKTILWETGVEQAGDRCGHVLTCRGVEAEASLSFAALSDLLEVQAVEESAPALAPPRRRALEIALRLAEPGDHAPDTHTIGLAILDVLRVLAERGPILVALDDAQWLDVSSVGVLQVAFRRLRQEHVGLLATLRKGPEVPSALELGRSFPAERAEQLSIGPLTMGALHNLLRQRLGLELSRPELARVHEATGGNPYFALELGRELVRTGTRPTAGRALAVPETLQELLGGRLARLPGETLDVLLQVAALARPTVELVAAVQGDRERVLGALEAAAAEGVVEVDDSRLRFAHPLLASICYEQAPVWKRRAVHRALAAVVDDVEERARHLALAAEGFDAAVASELDTAADHAAVRGATDAAAELSELAADLTPDDAPARRRRLRAAHLHRLAGDLDRAVVMLQQLRVEAPPGVEQADALFELASTLRGDPSTLIELCDEALAQAAGDDPRSTRILAFRTWGNLLAGNARAALVDGRSALEKAERVDDPAVLAIAIARTAHAETWAADITPGLIERGVEIEERFGLVLDYNESPLYGLAHNLMRLGEFDRARAILEEVKATAATRGDEGTRVVAFWTLGMLEWFAGRWQQALDHALTAHELTEQTLFPYARAWVGRVKALVEADLGLVDEARASAEESLAFTQATSIDSYTNMTLGVLGRLELALGNLEAAAGYLRELPARFLAGGVNDPTITVWADAIETLTALGELERARDYLEPYELHARRFGSSFALEGALRCRGLLTAAEGDLEASLTTFEAVRSERAERSSSPFERGRTLLCLGTVRRQAQQKRAAREALEQALAIFEELGARLWAEKARAELARISGRAPASEELTETERRVAELAAQGRTNKQIAAELYMGLSTVEAHLSHVYRKLGVRRAELGARLAAEPGEAVGA